MSESWARRETLARVGHVSLICFILEKKFGLEIRDKVAFSIVSDLSFFDLKKGA